MLESYQLSRQVLLTGVGLIYLVAFGSLYLQAPGLFGCDGLLPSANPTPLQPSKPLWQNVLQQPALLWNLVPGRSVDTKLDVACLLGMALALATVVRPHAAPLLGCWALYLALLHNTQTFLSFQWDILLLEAGFLMALLAPWRVWNVAAASPPSAAVVWMLRALLFKLLLMSGVVKLQSQCPTWLGLTAMTYHHATTCLPGPLAWYLHRLPRLFNMAATAATLAFELPLTLLVLAPQRGLRLVSAALQSLLQLSIIASGNYTFFNWLTILLCLAQLDDRCWLWLLRLVRRAPPTQQPPAPAAGAAAGAAPTGARAAATPATSTSTSSAWSWLSTLAQLLNYLLQAAILVGLIGLSVVAFRLVPDASAARGTDGGSMPIFTTSTTSTSTMPTTPAAIAAAAAQAPWKRSVHQVVQALYQQLERWSSGLELAPNFTVEQVQHAVDLVLPYALGFTAVMVFVSGVVHSVSVALSTHRPDSESKGLSLVTRLVDVLSAVRWTAVLCVVLAVFVAGVPNYLEGSQPLRPMLPPAVMDLRRQLHPWFVSHSYGLFRHMTGVGKEGQVARPEILIEASYDGRTWIDVPFRYKIGDIYRVPPIVAPYQPRLDWQMWFAALGQYNHHPWFIHLMWKILSGSPSTLQLLAPLPDPDDPLNTRHHRFERDPPHFVRATLYHYGAYSSM